MKNNPSHLPPFGVCLFILSFILLSSCYNWTLSPELVGTWESENIEITVRTKTAEKEWIFITDSARISVTIHADQLVTGSIGTATFDKGKIRKNAGIEARTEGGKPVCFRIANIPVDPAVKSLTFSQSDYFFFFVLKKIRARIETSEAAKPPKAHVNMPMETKRTSSRKA